MEFKITVRISVRVRFEEELQVRYLGGVSTSIGIIIRVKINVRVRLGLECILGSIWLILYASCCI